MLPTQNIHVRSTIPLVTPSELRAELPMSETANRTVVTGRQQVEQILAGDDGRLMVIVGPCSIHDPEAGLEYARKLAALSKELADHLFIVMRVYFEKPRTTVGWKGLINDPHLDDSFDIGTGLRLARRLLLDINELGLPAGTEMLEPITPQYIADLVTWASIGARTTESPTHRQMASGLSMPVGFKNGTDGELQVAIDAMQASRSPHSFVGIDELGRTSIVQTTGNHLGHLILRGGRSGPNYDPESLASAASRLARVDLPTRLVVDCSHANSNKDYRRQAVAWNSVLSQRLEGNASIIGMMIESNLKAGNQKLQPDRSKLEPGVSITDACIGWEETEMLLRSAHSRVSQGQSRIAM